VRALVGLTFKSGSGCQMDEMAGLLIGQVAERAGVSAPTIRYYEEIGLLPKPTRSSTGYRRYPETAVEELRFIRKAQALGFSLDEIAEILKLSRAGGSPCSHVRSLGHQHLAAVEERIRQLQHFREQLASEVARWDAQQAVPTCGGLCQFIASAEPQIVDVNLHLSASQRRKR
jgi:DNA-binding transcriptional MerR regulator